MLVTEHMTGTLDGSHHLFEQLQSARANVLYLIGEERLGGAKLLQQAMGQAQSAGHLAVHIDLTGRLSHSFYGLKAIMSAFEPVIRREAPELLRAYGAEWRSLFPLSAGDELFAGVPVMDEIALPASERRLSRENEQTFRLIIGMSTLLLQSLEFCPSLQGKTLWIFAHRFDMMDRLTGHAMHHLLLRHHPQVRLVATMEELPTQVQRQEETDLIRYLFHDRQVQAEFLYNVTKDLQPDLFTLQSWSEQQVHEVLNRERPGLARLAAEVQAWSGAAPGLIYAWLTQPEALSGSLQFQWSEQERTFLRQYRSTYAKPHLWEAAGLEAMEAERLLLAEHTVPQEAIPAEEMQTHHATLYNALLERGCPDVWTKEEYESHLSYHAFQAGQPAAGFEHLQQAVAVSEHWGNYENVLAIVKQAFRSREAAFTPEQYIYLWKRCGLIQAFLGQYDHVNAAYEQALHIADHPTQRAQLYAYLTLVATKRLGDSERAEQLAQQGLQEIAGLMDEASLLERGWLHNTLALGRFFQKRYKEAYELCKSAFEFLKTVSNSEALHLKINLVSNMSVVVEEMGNVQMALKIWRNFRAFLQGGNNRLFTKIYYYREAGLLLKLGEWQEALDLLQRSYQEADAIGDQFHMDFIARDISSLYLQQGMVETCIAWLHKSEQCAQVVGNRQRVNGAQRAAAAVAAQAGEDTASVELDVQAVIAKELRQPRTKLGMPFYLIHVPYGHVIKE